jgi:hypothetical protein
MRDANNAVMGSMRSIVISSMFVVFAVASCKGATSKQGSSSATGSGSASKVATPEAPKGPQPMETTYDKMQADKLDREAEAADAKAVTGNDEWVPAEFKAGAARWKDVGVYVDGKPMGFLTFGELPIALKPTWVKDKVSAEKRPGTDDPGWRWAQQRFYRFDQYLPAIGIDVKSIKELHVYGPKFSETNISTAKDLLGPKGKEFTFRFGGNVYGKPIAHVPEGFGNGRSADKIASVMIYIKKKPPHIVHNVGLELDGEIQYGVPYYGEPIRGGVRVYFDDKLIAIIKRQELDAAKAVKGPAGELSWKLSDVLAAQGATPKKVVEIWAVRDEKRQEKFPGGELDTLMFSANSQAKGGVLLGDKKIRANTIALHSRALKPDEIPTVTVDDE